MLQTDQVLAKFTILFEGKAREHSHRAIILGTAVPTKDRVLQMALKGNGQKKDIRRIMKLLAFNPTTQFFIIYYLFFNFQFSIFNFHWFSYGSTGH